MYYGNNPYMTSPYGYMMPQYQQGYGQEQQPQSPVPSPGAFFGLSGMDQLKVSGQANSIIDSIMGPRSMGQRFTDSAKDLWGTNIGKAGLGLNVASGVAQLAMGEDPAKAVGSTAGGIAGGIAGNMILPGAGGVIGSAVGNVGGSLLGGLFGDDEKEAEKERKKQERMTRLQGLSQNMAALGAWYSDDAQRRHAAIMNAFG